MALQDAVVLFYGIAMCGILILFNMLQVLESLLDDLEILPTRLQKKAVSLLPAESCVTILFRA